MNRVKAFVQKIWTYDLVHTAVYSIVLELIVECFNRRGIMGLAFPFMHPVIFIYNTLIIMTSMALALFFRRRMFVYSVVSAFWIILALELGATDLVLFGGIGDRFDHTLANAHYLLSLLKKGVRARLVDDKNCVEVIDRQLTLHGKVGDLVSTLPLSMEVTGITLKGFSYPLTDATLTLDGDYIAVSNVLAEETATIDIKSGYLYVIRSRD